MLLHLSSLGGVGPNFCKLPYTSPPSSDDDRDKIRYVSKQNQLHRRREESFSSSEENGGDDEDNTELAGKKKARKEDSYSEIDSSSSGNSCFMAFVTDSDLDKDYLYLPKDFTTLNGIKKKYRKIVLTNGNETSWEMDLRFNISSDTFYITGGWRNFCNEKGKKEGDFFIFKLEKYGETLFLSFNDGDEKTRVRRQNRFVKLTHTQDSLKSSRLYIPLSFMRENGLNKPGMITLVSKNGMKTVANIRKESIGRMSIGKGWKDFAKANGLKTDESFTMELIWENETPVLSFASRNHNRFVTLTLTYDNLRKNRQQIPKAFVRENGLDKPGIITLLNKDGTKRLANLLRASTGRMSLGMGWKEFVRANGLNIGESFTLELLWQNETPMLSLSNTDPTSDTRHQGECSKASKKESVSSEPSSGKKTRKAKCNSEETRDSSSAIVNRFVTLTLIHEDVRDCKLILPSQFMRTYGINRFGRIILSGQNGTEFYAFIPAKDGIIGVGIGWEGFCAANGVKKGESFTLELISQQGTTHVFKFRSNSDKSG